MDLARVFASALDRDGGWSASLRLDWEASPRRRGSPRPVSLALMLAPAKPGLNVADVRRLAKAALARSRATHGRADAELSSELRTVEADSEFSSHARRTFNNSLRASGSHRVCRLDCRWTANPIGSRRPSLANYQSRASCPNSADVVMLARA